jgi:hypothetical protein
MESRLSYFLLVVQIGFGVGDWSLILTWARKWLSSASELLRIILKIVGSLLFRL